MSFAQLKETRLARQSGALRSISTELPTPVGVSDALSEKTHEVTSELAQSETPARQLDVVEESPGLGSSASSGTPARDDDPDKDALETSKISAHSSASLDSSIEGLDDRRGLYAVIASHLYVKETRYAGRGVFVSRDVRAGSVLFDTALHASVLSTPRLAALCSTCCAPATPARTLKRCSRCQIVHYCSPKCSEADWPMHKPECAALRRWATAAPNEGVAVPSEAIRCIARMLWAKQRHGMDSVFAQELDAMQSNKAALAPSSVEAHMHLAHALVRYLGLSSPAELTPFGIASAGALVDVLSRFATNALGLSDPALAPLGVYASPPVALLNHACAPNAAAMFPELGAEPGREVRVRVVAIQDIAAGEEITTAYVDTTLPTALRRAALSETYRFDCSCSLCSKSTNLDPRETLWCPRACGGICPFPQKGGRVPTCARCKAPIPAPEAILDAVRLGTEALEKAESIQGKDPERALKLATKLLPLVRSAGLTPGAHPLLALTRLRQPFLVDALSGGQSSSTDMQTTLDEAIHGAAAVCTGLDAVLEKGHPVRAIARAELGKLLAADEPAPSHAQNSNSFPPSGARRVLLAKDTLAMAHAELMVGLGKDGGGGVVGREVRECIIRLEEEMGVLKLGIKNVRESG